MNISLPYIPERSEKPRDKGITMMMDKGLSVSEVENFIETSAQYTDFVKFGFGTSLVSTNVREKVKKYKKAKIQPYFGGTLFEAFVIRNMFEEYLKFLDHWGIDAAEVSDGSMAMPHEQKLEYISRLARVKTVLSEVGSKQQNVVLTTTQWVSGMKTELEAGAWKVIAEARESGTVGIYHSNGSANQELISEIAQHIPPDKIIWEAPTGKQQVYFIKQQGAEVNLGNIAFNDVIPLECLRRGLRGDTFFEFLPSELQKFKPGE